MRPTTFDETNVTLEAPSGKEDRVQSIDAMVGVADFGDFQERVVVTRWSPTAEERKRIADGDDVYLHVLGQTMPPVFLDTDLSAEPH